MANEKNLIPGGARTSSERRENARKAGIASGEARRTRKTARECAELILSLPVTDGRTWNRLAREGIAPDDINNMTLMIAAAIKAAQQGDIQALKAVLKIIGEDEPDSGDTQALRKAEELLGGTDSAID